MKKQWKQKWIEALRSGRYHQGQGYLRSVFQDPDGNRGDPALDKYCCLGVLCDLVDPSGWDAGGSYYNKSYMPPRDILVEVGLRGEEASKLAEANDRWSTFGEIATLIDALPDDPD